ncbi:MAG: iron ABC transporter permease [Chloroflexi bacterium]|nr:iron ABC transporter permease [Chloroflexota bacterium]MCL5275907.1 iron ABC transporter permease [Chloroflexota bacterium]
MSLGEIVGALRMRRKTARATPPPWAMANKARPRILIIAMALGVVAIALLSTGVGSVFIPPLTVAKILLSHLPLTQVQVGAPSTFEVILFDIRLPRVALVALTGAALATSGTAYQGLFRNPLADPYLIGVAAGAGLGAIGAIALRTTNAPSISAFLVPLASFIGALATVALVYQLGRIGRTTPTTTLILAGVAVGSLATALSTFILLRLGQQMVHVMAFLLGGYSAAGWEAVVAVAPFTFIGFALMYLYARPLNLLLFDEEQARHLGVNVGRVKLVIIVAATLTTAGAVAFSGLIGFVGLVVPHAARLVIGPDHRRLLPLAALGGAGFLMLADLLARTVIAPEELPLGVVTAFVGAPFFLYLLRRARNAAFF